MVNLNIDVKIFAGVILKIACGGTKEDNDFQ